MDYLKVMGRVETKRDGAKHQVSDIWKLLSLAEGVREGMLPEPGRRFM